MGVVVDSVVVRRPYGQQRRPHLSVYHHLRAVSLEGELRGVLVVVGGCYSERSVDGLPVQERHHDQPVFLSRRPVHVPGGGDGPSQLIDVEVTMVSGVRLMQVISGRPVVIRGRP